MKKSLEAIISPLSYEIIVSLKIQPPLNCIIKAIIGYLSPPLSGFFCFDTASAKTGRSIIQGQRQLKV
jgi:hypothetical protein